MQCDKAAFVETLSCVRRELLAARVPGGHWEGALSSSALSTATAVCALAVSDREGYAPLVARGLAWLAVL